MPHLLLDNVHFSYGTAPLLQGLTMTIRAGEFVALVGPSGSGKSTVLNLLTGLVAPTSGRVRVQGAPPAPGRVALMPQQDCLMPWRTALDNAAAGLEVQGVRRAAARARARELWSAFGLGGAEDLHPAQLSGGMRQRVAFLRTVLGNHDILLLDEPFGALDALTRANMQAWLLELWEGMNKTVLFVTHDAEEAVLLSDRVYVLSGTGIEIPVDLPRPRRYQLVTDAALMAQRSAVLAAVGLC